MLFRAWFTIALFAALLVAAAPPAHSNAIIRVEPGDSSGAVVQPPQLVTRSFRVSNLTAIELPVQETVRLPADWQLVAANPGFALPAAAQDLRLICVAIPPHAPPGRYRLEYSACSASDPLAACSAATIVTVLPWIRLEAELGSPPQRIISGEQCSIPLRIRNYGNTACEIVLTPAASTQVSAALNRNRVTLAAGATDTLSVTLKADRGVRVPIRHRLAVNIAAPKHPEAGLQVVAPAALEITPHSVQSAPPYHRVPSTAAARYVSGGSAGALQLEYSGHGTLDPRGRYQVDYRLRGPHDVERNLFGLRDEYVIGLRSREVELRAGDQMFSLSPLTEQNRIGRGASVGFSWNRFSGGAYVFKSRLKYPDLEEHAAYARVAVNRRLAVRVNLLNKATAAGRRDIAGIAAAMQPLRGTKVDVEYAAGAGLGDDYKLSRSALGRLDTRVRGALLTLEKIYAERDFPGYFRDYDQNMAAVYMPLHKRLQWQASYRQIAQNLNRDQTQTAALRDRQWQAGVTYTFPFRMTGSLTAEDRERNDVLEPAHFGYRERSLLLTVRQNFACVALEGTARGGRRIDFIQDYSTDFGRFGAGITYAPGRRQSYYASFQTGHYESAKGPRSDRIIRLRAQYRVIRNFTLAAGYQRNNSPERRLFDNNQFDVDAGLTFLGAHKLSLRYRRIAYEHAHQPWGTSFMLSYEAPLGLPVGRHSSAGRVKGRVINDDNGRRSGVAGALLSLDGTSTRTDERGYFCFPEVTPEQHYLQVDRASIGFERTTTIPTPVPLTVRRGRTVSQALEITRSGSMRGEITMLGLTGNASSRGIFAGAAARHLPELGDSTELERLRGMAGIELELQCGGETVRVLTDSRGRFSCNDLRPGVWTLYVPPTALPPFHKLAVETYTVDLKPGANEEIAILVVPIVRTITVVDEGAVPIVRRTP